VVFDEPDDAELDCAIGRLAHDQASAKAAAFVRSSPVRGCSRKGCAGKEAKPRTWTRMSFITDTVVINRQIAEFMIKELQASLDPSTRESN
jgi:hypothetical protein